MSDILIYNDIGDWYDGVTATSVADQLGQVPISEKLLNVRINSVGGDVSHGLAIRNLFRSFAAKRRLMTADFKLITIVDGFAYSAASVIAMAGDTIVMNQGSLMMIHQAWTWSMGNATELRNLASYLDKIDGELAALYAARSGDKPDDMLALMSAETYFTASEAVAAKLADQVDESHLANLAEPDRVALAQARGKPNGYTELMKSRVAAARGLPRRPNNRVDAPDLSWLSPAESAAMMDSLSI